MKENKIEGDAAWISRAFMHLGALCMPETPFPDDYNAIESTRHLLLPRLRLRSAQFGLHKELALLYPELTELAASDASSPENRVARNGKVPPKQLTCSWQPDNEAAILY
jgi:hypothetical protein